MEVGMKEKAENGVPKEKLKTATQCLEKLGRSMQTYNWDVNFDLEMRMIYPFAFSTIFSEEAKTWRLSLLFRAKQNFVDL